MHEYNILLDRSAFGFTIVGLYLIVYCNIASIDASDRSPADHGCVQHLEGCPPLVGHKAGDIPPRTYRTRRRFDMTFPCIGYVPCLYFFKFNPNLSVKKPVIAARIC